jgi:hypothetical protein
MKPVPGKTFLFSRKGSKMLAVKSIRVSDVQLPQTANTQASFNFLALMQAYFHR